MARYKPTRKPKYVPLTRWTIARKLRDLPQNVQHAIRKSKGKLVYTTECPVCCKKDALMIFDTGDGEWLTCGNPECPNYGDADWFPKKGGA